MRASSTTVLIVALSVVGACSRVSADIRSVDTLDLSHDKVLTFVVSLPSGVSWQDDSDVGGQLAVRGSAGTISGTVVGDNPYAVTVEDLVEGTVALVIPEGRLADTLGNASPEIVSAPVTITDSEPTAPVLGPLHDLSASQPSLDATWELGPDVDLTDVAWGVGPSANEPPAHFTSLRSDATSVTITAAEAPDCQGSHLWVRVTDAAGQFSETVSEAPFFVDTTPPTAMVQIEDNATTSQAPLVSWADVVENCPADPVHFVRIGTEPELADVLDMSIALSYATSYQPRDGFDDVSLTLEPGRTYYTTVGLRDQSGNEASLSTPWSVNNGSCKGLKDSDRSLPDGTYDIDWDRDGTEAGPVPLFCDMTTDGGGWTLAVRYDRRYATPKAFSLPEGTGRQAIHAEDLAVRTADTTHLGASIDLRPFIASGATHLMHATLDDADKSYQHVYFSEIYTTVREDPDRLWDVDTYDTNLGDGVAGTPRVWSEDAADRWLDADFSVMAATDTDGRSNRTMISGGEGDAMFTNGDRNGAIYSSGSAVGGNIAGTNNPKVHWNFYGQDGSQGDYGGNIHIGNYCRDALDPAGCESTGTYSLMFVR